LRQYRSGYDEKLKVFKNTPKHDWCFSGETEVLTRYGTCQIRNLPTTGEVLTPCGWRPYINPRVTRRAAPLVEVRFADGLTVKCTPDHSFATESGWRYAQDLQKDFQILSCLTRSRRISMAVYTAAGQVIDIGRAAARSCIETFGRSRSVPFQAGVISTIGTATRTTTGWPILSACRGVSIFRRLGTLAVGQSGKTNTSAKVPAPRRLSGTGQKKDVFGTSVTLSGRRAGPSGSGSSGRASIAASISRLWSVIVGTRSGSAPQLARPLRIASVERLNERADVWCLTVPEDQCFALSNGAVVHNCSHAADAFRYLAMAWREMAPSTRPNDPVRELLRPRTMGEVFGGFEDDQDE
jgi:hypothetical protein